MAEIGMAGLMDRGEDRLMDLMFPVFRCETDVSLTNGRRQGML